MQKSNTKGFTLIELIVVVSLIAVLMTLGVSRFDSLAGFKQTGELRKFSSAWQFVAQEAVRRNENYLLVLDIDKQQYFVKRQVVKKDNNKPNQVDYLANLRLDSEKKSRSDKSLKSQKTLAEEFKEKDAELGGSLENLFYQGVFPDPYVEASYAKPLEFLELAEPINLGEGMSFKSVDQNGNTIKNGNVLISLPARGRVDDTIVVLDIQGENYKLDLDTLTSAVNIKKLEK